MIPPTEIPEPWLTSDPAAAPTVAPPTGLPGVDLATATAAVPDPTLTAAAPTAATAEAPSRTKRRRYKVSPKVLAANRQNLVHANAVPNEIRYRPTEKRLDACHRNLEKAVAAKKKNRSANYAPSLTVGWYVADPERALALVGATPEEYRQHLRSFRRIVAPRDEREAKLAHALGILSWRWLAALRLEGDRQELGVCHLLDSLVARRRAHIPFEPREATEFYDALEQVLSGWMDLDERAQEVGDRALELWKQLVELRNEEPMPRLAHPHARPSTIALTFDDYSAGVLGGPGISSSRTCARLDPQPNPVAPVEAWEPWNIRRPGNSTVSQGHEATSQYIPDPFGSLPRPDLGALVRAWRSQGRTLPVNFAGFLRLVRAALGTARSRPGGRKINAAARDEKLVRLLAQTLWERMTVLRRHSEEAEAWLNARAGEYAAKPNLESFPGHSAKMADRGIEFVHFFSARRARAAKEIDRLQGRLREVFYLLCVERFGRLPTFELMGELARGSVKERARLRRVRRESARWRARDDRIESLSH